MVYILFLILSCFVDLQDEIKEYVVNNMWNPEYPTLVYRKE
jgi:hypothetical protein